jgi:hypothetical protein
LKDLKYKNGEELSTDRCTEEKVAFVAGAGSRQPASTYRIIKIEDKKEVCDSLMPLKSFIVVNKTRRGNSTGQKVG